jgi:hypothetical protein
MMKKARILAMLLVATLALVACGVGEDPELDSGQDHQWGTGAILDTALFRGFVEDEYVSLDLMNSPKQFERFALTPEIKELLTNAQFPEGKEFMVQYRPGKNGLALIEEIHHMRNGEKLKIATGLYQGTFSNDNKVVVSTPGLITEFNLDEEVRDEFLGRFSKGQHMVIYYRVEGLVKVIVDFE